ncbi:MAG: acetyl-CoA carboxylase biotin carboxyl carrier protein subunit, partial [Thermoleophilaceae bacterium]
RKAPRRERRTGGAAGGAPGALVSPIQGTVLKVAVEQGGQVEEGALVCVIEAMKMENEITAPSAGTVEELGISEGGAVATGDTIAVIK